MVQSARIENIFFKSKQIALLLKQMGKRIYLIVILVIPMVIGTGFYSFEMKKKGYTYIDGNNNRYEITSSYIDYKPVKPENSSSGTYSGGEAKKAAITKEQFQKLEALMTAVKNDRENQVATRLMGCGTLYFKGSKNPVYIGMNAKSKASLEEELKLVLFGI
jgi:hypothetical protein